MFRFNRVRVWYVAAALMAVAGCSTKPKPWREDRNIGPHFFVEEWVLGTTDRTEPIEAKLEEAVAASIPNLSPGQPLPGLDSEPHGLKVRVTGAELYRRIGGDLKHMGAFEGNIRFWLSPNKMQVAAQDAWRDSKMRLFGISGRKRELPQGAFKGLPPTYRGFPFAFLCWAPDSLDIQVTSLHPAKVRGYPYLARWRVTLSSGHRELLGQRILLLSKEVADWRLIAIPQDATLQDVARVLQKTADDSKGWVKRSALDALELVRKRMEKEY